MNCPRCKSPIGALSSPDAIVTCPGCGTRLMTRSAALRSQGGAAQVTRASAPPQEAAPSLDTGPDSSQRRTAVKVGPTTLGGPSASGAYKVGGRSAAGAPGSVTLEQLLAEIQAVRATQQLILDVLGNLRLGQGGGAAAPTAEVSDDGEGPSLSPIRAGQRKSVVLVDDDPQTRQAAVEELERAAVPVRAFADSRQALAAIAEDKPDVIILELALGGDMGGKDLVNMIKATMEWVDIPIVLWTREKITNPREARQVHGADDVVAKGAGAAALVARVISTFRR
jgi:CheY-like chemotaxis protein/uncharacterized Zn finger protein (UPF0148 family)